MAQDLPLILSNPWYELTVPLDQTDGSVFVATFEFRWNFRDLSWYFTMRDDAQTPMVTGVRVVLGTFLGHRSQHKFFNNNALAALDLSHKGQEAGLDDFGSRVILRILSAHEILVLNNALPAALKASGSVQ